MPEPILITPASTPVVSLERAKAWCRVEGTASDTLVTELLVAAQRHIEQIVGRSLGEQTWRLTLDGFSDAIELPRGPVTGIVSNGFKYRDPAGLEQVVDPELYSLDLVGVPAWIVRNEGQDWPETLDGVNAVSVEFTAGYAANQCPPDLMQAVRILVAYWFDNRDKTGLAPDGVAALVDPYRTGWVAA